jgi:hypothetical protein
MRKLSPVEGLTVLTKALRNRINWLVRGKGELQRLHTEVYWPGKDFVLPKINARITVFRAPKQYYGYVNDPLMGWGSRTTSTVEIHVVAGSKHRLLLSEPFVRQIASTLLQSFERVRTAQPGEQTSGIPEVAEPVVPQNALP